MRITIVSYHFTPSTMVAALRARGLAKFLSRAGHVVTVITAQVDAENSPEWRLVIVPGRTASSRMRESLGVSQHHTVVDALSGEKSGGGAGRQAFAGALKLARRAAQELLFWPDEYAGWARSVRERLSAQVGADEVDLIISTSPPPSTHMAVVKSARGAVPWVVDYRDLWTLAHHYPLSALRRAIDRRAEDRVVREAAAVTVATDGFADIMRRAWPEARVFTVYNGFDPEMFELPERTQPNTKLTLVHAGNLYGGRVDPAVLFAAVRRVIDDGRVPGGRIAVELYSAREGWLLAAVAEHGLTDIVTVQGIQPRERVLEVYRDADVLTLLQWDSPGEAAVLPAKMLEYLASRRSILAIGSPPGGEVERMLGRTRAGRVTRSVDETAEAIAELYAQFADRGFVSVETPEDARAEWSQSAMAAAMQRAIDAACEPEPAT